MKIDIYCDGSCLGNPGAGGWSAIIIMDGKEQIIKGGAKLTTNNQMELTAALMSMNHLANLALPSDSSINIHTDSQYLQQGVTSWSKNWLRNGFRTAEKKPIKNQELWRAILNHPLLPKTKFHWVRGHDGHKENEKADDIARTEAIRWR